MAALEALAASTMPEVIFNFYVLPALREEPAEIATVRPKVLAHRSPRRPGPDARAGRRRSGSRT